MISDEVSSICCWYPSLCLHSQLREWCHSQLPEWCPVRVPGGWRSFDGLQWALTQPNQVWVALSIWVFQWQGLSTSGPGWCVIAPGRLDMPFGGTPGLTTPARRGINKGLDSQWGQSLSGSWDIHSWKSPGWSLGGHWGKTLAFREREMETFPENIPHYWLSAPWGSLAEETL